MKMRVFVFVKDWKCAEGTIPAGTQIELFRGAVSKMGGVLMPAYQQMFLDLIEEEEKYPYYLEEREMTHNEI